MLYCVSFFLVMRRPPRSTLSSSSAASDVYKRQDVPCVLRRVARVRRGKREHAYDVVAMQRPSRVPKWIRNPLQGPRQKLEELEEDSEQVCSVCLEGSFHVSCVELACRHKFHQKCIRQWIQKSPEGQSVSCPMCKGEIGEIPHSRTCTR
eukprot:TRINITY_DN1094_c0_g1_i1.p1 TRINITY_DN1094_c0_g1~~TRINITY_DN1094_c0_g1_i1.p1  ORF type:complete len:150 (-),score=13.55 TRINITY_DN1094_c0_g1_i1:138-587(-)